MSFLNLMRNRLKPKEVNDALMEVEERILPVTTSASTGQMLGLTGENKTPAWVDNPLPATTGATTGQILKLTGENKTPSWADEYSYTPPAYSETEVNTGQKWIDGKDIFVLSFSGTTSETSGNDVLKTIDSDLNIINMTFIYFDQEYVSAKIQRLGTSIFYQGNTGRVTYAKGTTTSVLSAPYICTIYYTKPDPAPETRDDDTPEEVKETKTTRKKTTK